MRNNFTIALISLAVLAGTAHSQPIDQIPMYGGMDRASIPSLWTADEKLIADTTKHYGTREKASSAFVGNGFFSYGRNDLAVAIRRFNQAWLIDPNNPEVYWGFASVLHDQGKHCEAMKQFDKAMSYGKYFIGMDPDAAKTTVLCGLEDKSLTVDPINTYFERADAIYEVALKRELNKGYVHGSMATSFYWRGRYQEAWNSVKLAHAQGFKSPETFLKMLRNKMPEPE